MRAPLSKDGYEEVMGWEDRDGEEKTLDDAAAIKAGSGAGAMSPEACEIAATELGASPARRGTRVGSRFRFLYPWCVTA